MVLFRIARKVRDFNDLLDDIAYYKKESIREQESANQNVQWLNKILEAIDAIDEPEEARQANLT